MFEKKKNRIIKESFLCSLGKCVMQSTDSVFLMMLHGPLALVLLLFISRASPHDLKQ